MKSTMPVIDEMFEYSITSPTNLMEPGNDGDGSEHLHLGMAPEPFLGEPNGVCRKFRDFLQLTYGDT